MKKEDLKQMYPRPIGNKILLKEIDVKDMLIIVATNKDSDKYFEIVEVGEGEEVKNYGLKVGDVVMVNNSIRLYDLMVGKYFIADLYNIEIVLEKREIVI